MACGDYSGTWPGAGIEAIMSGNFLDAVLCPHQMLYGGLVFALLIFGVLAAILYARTDYIAMPLVVFIFVGAIVVGELPAIAVQFSIFVMLVTIPLGALYLALKIDRR